VHDIAEFIALHEPFGELEESELKRLAASTEIEFFPAGTTIERRASPEVIWMVRRGSIELSDGKRLLDLLHEGELFGDPAVLSSLAPGTVAVAHEDSLCYALPASELGLELGRPIGSSLGPADAGRGAAEAAQRPARDLIAGKPVLCEPGTTVREAARQMVATGSDSILVQAGGELLGIVTDRDLRAVVARGRSSDSPVETVMSSPVITAAPDATGAEVMTAMLDHDVRHLPVSAGREGVLGVIDAGGLLAAEADAPFVLRRAIAHATDREELRSEAQRLLTTTVAMHRAGLPHSHLSRVISIVSDALVGRMIELAVADQGLPPSAFAWLTLGSHGRREPVPSSDIDSGMSWKEGDAGPYMREVASDVAGCIEAVGWRLDPHGVTAGGQFGASAIGDWRRAIDTWLTRPSDERVLIALSILLDGRVSYGDSELDPTAMLRATEDRPALMSWLLRLALASKPPTGFFHDLVVESSGEHRGTLDIKRGGLLPIVDLARYLGTRAGAAGTATTERLRAAAEAGVIEGLQASVLEEAFDLFASLRLGHQVEQIEEGARPDDHLDPRRLTPLTRRNLRAAFREVGAIQKSLSGTLSAAV
jgi:CBS domain-containing protein